MTSTPRSWTRRRSTGSGTRPIQPLVNAVEGLRDVRDLAAFLGEFERIGGAGLFGSYIDTDDRNSDRYLFHITQGGLGLPDESYYRDDKFAEIREAYVGYLTRLLELGGARPGGRPRRRGADGPRPRHPPGQGALGARRDPRRPEDLQPDDPRGAPGAGAGLRLGGLRHQPRRQRRDDRRVVRPAAVLPRAPLHGARGGRHRAVAPVAAVPRAALRRALPARRLRADQLRLLRPHPQRHARAARAVEAWRRAGRGGHRRGRRPGLRRPPLPAGVQGDDGRPRGQPAPGLPRLHRGAGLDDRGDQAAGLRQARHLPAQDRLPGEVPRLQQPAGHRPAT